MFYVNNYSKMKYLIALASILLILTSLAHGYPVVGNTSDLIYDVIVVGGGVSGLTTMYQLSMAYNITNTLLIEGSDRLGGRIHTIPLSNDSHIELGAQVNLTSTVPLNEKKNKKKNTVLPKK